MTKESVSILDLGDERVVRHHHRHGAEEGLQVVRQLRAPGVPGVHGDEHAEAWVQRYLLSDELEDLILRHFSVNLPAVGKVYAISGNTNVCFPSSVDTLENT